MDPVRAFFPHLAQQECEYFAYTMHWDPIAASAILDEKNFTVDTSTYFIVLGVSHVLTNSAGTTEEDFAPIEIQITGSASSSKWNDKLTSLANLSGRAADTGNGVKRLEYPRLVRGGEQLVAQATNMAATAWQLYLTFHGVQVRRDLRRAIG